MSENPKLVPSDGVSKKLKVAVILLTALIFFAFIALFNKFSNRPSNKSIPEQKPHSLSAEYQEVGARLMNAGLKEQAIDQFIEVWRMQTDNLKRAKAAQTVGRLYADLGNCPEALVWLFRAEVAGTEKPLTPLIDACLAKVDISGR